MAMNFSELNERFSNTPLQHKIAGLALAMAALGGLFYMLLYSGLSEEADRLKRKVAELEQEKADYEDKKQKYMAFRAEVEKLLQEKKELVKVLPSRAEISSFLQSLHAKAELAGLTILNFDKQAERRRDFYAVIPVNMSITGTFHQISKFFYSIGQLKRIVNVRDVLTFRTHRLLPPPSSLSLPVILCRCL
jgi:type IV pilus assembly protein PilO